MNSLIDKKIVLYMVLLSLSFFGVFYGLSQPVRDNLSRLLITCCFLSFMAVLYLMINKKKVLRRIFVVALLILLVMMVFTYKFKVVEPTKFSKNLVIFEGIEYVWGGETKHGMDCSGLIRGGLFKTYLDDFNLGAALRIWLVDSSADDLPNVYREIFQVGKEYASIRSIPDEEVIPGAIAITSDRTHLLAYLGDGKWIQASPKHRRVLSLHKNEVDSYFTKRVVVHNLVTTKDGRY